MPTRRRKMDRGSTLEIPTQYKGIVVQQGSQAVLTPSHRLCRVKNSHGCEAVPPAQQETAPHARRRQSYSERGWICTGTAKGTVLNFNSWL